MAYTISQGEKAATWSTNVWIDFWQGFDQTDWEDETTTNWSALGG